MKKIKQHWLAGVLAVLSGLIIIVPPLIFRHNPTYQGIDFFGTDGETSYIAQVHAVYNGDFKFGNVFLYEYADVPYVKQPLPAMVMAGLGKLFFLSVPNAVILAKFVFPVLVFWFVYGFCLVITKDKNSSVLGATFIVLAPATTALLDPHAWLSILTKGVFSGSEPQFLFFSRPISPQVSNVFFFAYIYVLWYFLDIKEKVTTVKQWWLGGLASLLLGLSFYTYLFAYTLLFAMNGFLALYFLVQKDWGRFKNLCLITFGGLLIGIPYVWNMFQVFASPDYADLNMRVGQVQSHEFIISRVLVGITILLLLFYRKRDWFFAFSLSFLAAIFAVSNQQVLTGKTIPIPEHYHWYYMAPIGGFIILHILCARLPVKFRASARETWAVALLTLSFLIFGIRFQVWSYQYQLPVFESFQAYGPAMNWLRDNTTKDDVVFANKDFSEHVVVFTPANVYYSSYAGDALVPAERLRRAFYTYMYLDGVTGDQATDYFSVPANRLMFSNRVYSNYWRAKNGCYECYPEVLDQDFIKEYQTFYQADFLQNLKKYRITYAVWDKELNPNWKLGRFFTEAVFDDGRMRIFRVN